MRFVLTTTVGVDPVEAFRFLEESERGPRARWSLVPAAPHTSRRNARWTQIGPIDTEVVRREEPSLLVLRWTMGDLARGEVEYRVQPALGGAHVEQRTSVLSARVPSLALPLLRRTLHRASERRLERVRAALSRSRGKTG